MDPATMFAITQAISSVAGGATDQSGYKKVSNFDKNQKGIYGDWTRQANQLSGNGGGYENAMSLLQGYLDPNSDQYQNFEKPYLQQFEQQTIPGLAERFAGFGAQGGGLSSSGFGQSLGAAGANLQTDLASMKSNMQRQSIQDIIGQYNKISGGVMGAEPFSYVDQGPGLLSNIFSGFGGAKNPFGSPGAQRSGQPTPLKAGSISF